MSTVQESKESTISFLGQCDCMEQAPRVEASTLSLYIYLDLSPHNPHPLKGLSFLYRTKWKVAIRRAGLT